MITDEAYERFALQDVSRLPAFSYTGPTLHLGKSAVLLGEGDGRVCSLAILSRHLTKIEGVVLFLPCFVSCSEEASCL